MDRYPIETLLQNIVKIINKYFDIYKKLISKHSNTNNLINDPLQFNKLITKLFNKIVNDPDLMIKYQMSFFKSQLETIEKICQLTFLEENSEINDRRFKDKTWQEHSAFLWIKEAYFTYAQWMESLINDLPQNDFTILELKRLHFIIKQFLDAVAPSNFPHTNPEVLKTFFDTSGENFLRGLDNLLQDIENSKNAINIKSTDGSRFEIGKNVAITEGKVVYQNKIMQLLHYKPLTEKQHQIPLLIIPPFINKYYILDLQPSNSLVKWLLEQNYNVFLISWINPDESLSEQNLTDYILNGPIAALDYLSNFNIKQVNAMGYCIGGTLLAAALAYMKDINDDRIKTASFFTTLIDFDNAGDLSIFIDDHFINESKKYIEKSGGYIDGQDMSAIFSMLRSNDMIWPFYINNYLLGKDAFPFDILYWNEDSVRIPAALYLFCIEKLYKDNLLKTANAVLINGSPIDVGTIDVPCFFIAAKGDHIVPWSNAFNSAKLFSSPLTFVLTDSGHVAGIINPPTKGKYCYWTNDVGINQFQEANQWLESANKHKGSWWPYWHQWAMEHSGALITDSFMDTNFIEAAPGSYVKVRY